MRTLPWWVKPSTGLSTLLFKGNNMNTTYTPGPWSIRPRDLRQTIQTESGASVAHPCMNDDVSAIQCEANTHLIAAAPELLAALISLRQAIKTQAVISTVKALSSADAAITKATKGKK